MKIIPMKKKRQIKFELPNSVQFSCTPEQMQTFFNHPETLSHEQRDGLAMMALAVLLCDAARQPRRANGRAP
jgi:hypothetical protein